MDEDVVGRGLRFGGICLGVCMRGLGNTVMSVCMVLMVGVSRSIGMVGVVLVCEGDLSGCRAVVCSSPWQIDWRELPVMSWACARRWVRFIGQGAL